MQLFFSEKNFKQKYIGFYFHQIVNIFFNSPNSPKKRKQDQKVNNSKPIYLLISGFLVESIKTNKNEQKRSPILQYSFARNLTHFTNLMLLNIYFCNAAKSVTHFTKFPAKIFMVGVRKTFALHHFQTPKNCILEQLEYMSAHSFESLKKSKK